jgi:DNA-binding response OmpR family regulator
MHTILLVEDEAPLRELICDYLTAKSGGEWRVLPAADGTEGLPSRWTWRCWT